MVDTDIHSNDPKRLKKKRRRRKLSRSKTPNEGENAYTDEELSSEDDTKPIQDLASSIKTQQTTDSTTNTVSERLQSTSPNSEHDTTETHQNDTPNTTPTHTSNNIDTPETTTISATNEDVETSENSTTIVTDKNLTSETKTTETNVEENKVENNEEVTKVENKTKYRVDAEEFVPRAYRHQHSFEPVPIPGFVPVSMYGPPPTFVQAPLPINFIPGIPQSPYGFITNQFFPENDRFYIKHHETTHENHLEPIQMDQQQQNDVTVDSNVTENISNSCESVQEANECTKNLSEGEKCPKEETQNEKTTTLETSKQDLNIPKEENDNSSICTNKNSETVTSSSINKTQNPGEKHAEQPVEKVSNKSPKAVQKSPKTDKSSITKRQNESSKPKLTKQISEQPKIDQSKTDQPKIDNNQVSSRPKLERHKSEPNPPTSPKPIKTASSLFEPKLSKNSFPLPPKHSQPTEIAKSVPVLPNYSEKLKAQQNKKSQLSKSVCPRFDRSKKNEDTKKLLKVEESVKSIEPIKKYTEIKRIPVDQWIPVSSKKKRKNKLSCDTDTSNVIENGTEQSVEDEELNKILENLQAEDLTLSDIAKEQQLALAEIEAQHEKLIENESKTENTSTDIQRHDSRVAENETKSDEVIESSDSVAKEPEIVTELPTETCEMVSKTIVTGKQFTKEVNNTKKDKSNKGKKTKKRIIIFDQQIVQGESVNKVVPNKNEVNKQEDVCNEKKLTNNKNEEVVLGNEVAGSENKVEEGSVLEEKVQTQREKDCTEVLDNSFETQIKLETSKTNNKKKKKKSKAVKDTSENASVNCSIEDNYDFLSDNVSLPDTELKTNVEVSQELDRMIKRGLYANLEEKIKSVNPSDKFINSVSTNDFQFDLLKPSMEVTSKFGMLKNFNNFGIVFNNSTMNKTLEKAVVNKMTTELGNLNQKKNFDPNLNKSSDNLNGIASNTLPEISNETCPEEPKKSPPFPITRAVKEWMSRTREHTPEVEIFKDPNEIRNEFAMLTDSENSDVEFLDEPESKNVNGNPLSVMSPDVTVTAGMRVAKSKSPSQEQDLLDCDDELSSKDDNEKKLMTDDNNLERNGLIEQGEDALEVYECVYGTNAEYLEIQKEIEKKERETNLNFAKGGGLPYRAICCTVM